MPTHIHPAHALVTLALALSPLTGCHRASGQTGGGTEPPAIDTAAAENAATLAQAGQEIFRHETFGSEALWGGVRRLHETIAGDTLGGVGAGISPASALGVGLKVDRNALPHALQQDLVAGNVDLADPAVTVALLELDAVVGVKGFFDNGVLDSVGITCALCHSTVDDSLLPGIGLRRDGWPNRDLDVGTVIGLSQDLPVLENLLGMNQMDIRAVLQSWGPGRFDAHLNLDGKAFRPDGETGSVLLPAAFGLSGVNLATYTGWGSVSHWNAFVATHEMGGMGRFFDPRLNDPVKYPIAATHGFGNVMPAGDDQISPKLESLQLYQLSIPVPTPPAGSFDAAAAMRGESLFSGAADCARCHVPPLFTEPGWNAHLPQEIGIDDFQAMRSPAEQYRTTPLRGLFTRSKGGYYHDGRFATLPDVIEHYDQHFNLMLTGAEKSDLAEYMKSL